MEKPLCTDFKRPQGGSKLHLPFEHPPWVVSPLAPGSLKALFSTGERPLSFSYRPLFSNPITASTGRFPADRPAG
jgi:hypothetical protein